MNQTELTRPVSALAPIEDLLLKIAKDCIQEGPGLAQEMVVLRKAAEDLNLGNDLRGQQRLLTAWQNLFRTGQLSWGYDVGNPSAPFFHLPINS
jgi:hypothetical protein